MTHQEAYDFFRTCKQAARCLQTARQEFFSGEVLPEAWRDAYGAYLQRRIRPLAQALIEEEDVDGLMALDHLGWLTAPLTAEFSRYAAEHHKNAPLVWLLQKQQALGGWTRPDFRL